MVREEVIEGAFAQTGMSEDKLNEVMKIADHEVSVEVLKSKLSKKYQTYFEHY
jgi:hypothetical protein